MIKNYTLQEVEKHNKKDDLWTIYKNNVYDITNFVKNHPGGSIILNAGGKNLEEVWNEYGFDWHMEDNSVIKILKKYKIGKVKEKFKNKKINKKYKIFNIINIILIIFVFYIIYSIINKGN